MEKHVKLVFDGKAYWLLWHWEVFPAPETFPGGFHHASGPFRNPEEAKVAFKEKDTEGWTLIDFAA